MKTGQIYKQTNFVRGTFEDLLPSAKICQVATYHPLLQRVGNDIKFVLINNFFASADMFLYA